MKNAIKVLCFTLAVIIVGTSAFLIYFKWDKSQFEYVDGTEKGTVMITGYKDESKDVTIPSKLRGKKVTQIDTSAFEESDITSIEIGDNVTYIGKSAFRGCKSLKTVKLGKSILNIDEGSFNDCTSLKNVELEDGGNFVIKDGVLLSADMKTLYFALPYAKLGNYTCPSEVETINSLAFYNCPTLTGFNFSNKVKSIPQGMFVLCTGLKELNIPDSVTQIGSVIITKSGVKTVTIPESVKVIDKSAFIQSDGTNSKDLVLRVRAGSKAESFAKENSIKIEYIK